ncbi:MAG: DMT family transporter [Bifidobacteriaceae bacterium]|jgi:transporter family-2 protein|nr:DMT family transporter [Bifidobacteriaceae bacterium]
MVALVVGLAIGFGIPLQTSINSRLRDVFGSPFVSSLISFAIGTVFLAVVTVLAGYPLGVDLSVVESQPLWLWLGGFLGVVYLTSNILLFPRLGSVQTVIFPVLGQILMGLFIDSFGWFRAPVQALTPLRILGSALVLGGVIISVALPGYLARKGKESREVISGPLTKSDITLANPAAPARRILSSFAWRAWGVIAGMMSAAQTAVNGNLGTVLGSPYRAAFISFFIGTVVLLAIVAILHPHITYSAHASLHRWWMWIGGIIGSFFVLGNAYLAPIVGTGFTVVIVLIGLITGSLLVDQYGWCGARKKPVSIVQIIGLLVMIMGVVVIRVLS